MEARNLRLEDDFDGAEVDGALLPEGSSEPEGGGRSTGSTAEPSSRLAAQRPHPTFSNIIPSFLALGESKAAIISRRCLDSDKSAKPGMVIAKWDVIWRIASGPWLTKSRMSFSGVTAAAAASPIGEFVLRGPDPEPPALDDSTADDDDFLGDVECLLLEEECLTSWSSCSGEGDLLLLVVVASELLLANFSSASAARIPSLSRALTLNGEDECGACEDAYCM